MSDSMIKSGIVLLFWLITAPNIFSVITSLVAIVYFASMLKINVVDKNYEGKWLNFFKSWFQ